MNKEKEPLSGTAPESWLFDKSLQEHVIRDDNYYPTSSMHEETERSTSDQLRTLTALAGMKHWSVT